MGQQLTTIAGTDADWQVTATDSAGAAVVFTGAEGLSARVWPGEGLPTLFNPPVGFLVPSAGTLKLTISAAQTAALEPGLYRLQVLVITTGGRLIPAFDGSLEVTTAPGAQAAGPVYCSYADVLAVESWLARLQSKDQDVEGFAPDRAEARVWIDGIILASCPVGRNFGMGGGFGFDQRAFAQSWESGSLLPSRWLVDKLAANALITTGPVGRPIAVAAATYAAARACKRQLGQGGKAAEWEMRGRRLEAEACVKITQCRAYLDLDGDGRPDFAVSLQITATRYA